MIIHTRGIRKTSKTLYCAIDTNKTLDEARIASPQALDTGTTASTHAAGAWIVTETSWYASWRGPIPKLQCRLHQRQVVLHFAVWRASHANHQEVYTFTNKNEFFLRRYCKYAHIRGSICFGDKYIIVGKYGCLWPGSDQTSNCSINIYDWFEDMTNFRRQMRDTVILMMGCTIISMMGY